jgi:hypothetical protein
MTKKRTLIAKRSAAERLHVNVEIAAAGYLHGFWRDRGMETRSYWESLAYTHGDHIRAKVHEATPGCRPGFEYATGKYPPIPLIGDPPPSTHKSSDDYIDIDGVRFWYCGRFADLHTWQPSQADFLRSLGEIDGAEWRRYLAWKRTRYEPRYVLDGADHRATTLAHMCY